MPRGFSLIELLITISIIGIISSFALVNFMSLSRGGRDAKRLSDLKTIQSALEQYYADQGFYPTTALNDEITAGRPLTNAVGAPGISEATKTYLNNLPRDPASVNYIYKPFINKLDDTACDNSENEKCSYYCLYALVENDTTTCNQDNRGDYSGTGVCGREANTNRSTLCIDNDPNEPSENYTFILTPP